MALLMIGFGMSLDTICEFSMAIILNINMDALGLTEQLSDYIIRPPRSEYSLNDLGEAVFNFKKITFERTDFSVPRSDSNPRLECSFYRQKFNSEQNNKPTVLYLHANSSSRLTVKNYLKNLIPYFNVLSFDFRGCGMSQGQYLTLGYLQKYDVKAVIDYMDENFGESKYLIWGRSMGAVTAILYTAKFAARNGKVLGLVLDSPFSDLEKLINFMADKKMPIVPNFIVQSAVDSLSETVRQKIQKQYRRQFLIRQHKPINQIGKIKVPIFFIGSKNDEIVDGSHLKELYDKANCTKQMQILQGGHNEIRPQHLKMAVLEFLIAAQSMKKQPSEKRESYNRVEPEISREQEIKKEPESQREPGINRKKIFDLQAAKLPDRSIPKTPQTSQNDKEQKPKLDQPIQSAPRTNRLFKDRDKSRNPRPELKPVENPVEKPNMANFSFDMKAWFEQDKSAPPADSVKRTQDQIMDKLMPKSGNARGNRIFTYQGASPRKR